MKRNKYGVSPKSERTYKGTVYASKLEMQYRQHLDLKIKANLVKSYTEQVPFRIVINDRKICVYKLDFEVHYTDGRVEYIDVKGMRKGAAYAMFRLKKKLVEAMFGVTIKEVTRKDF